MGVFDESTDELDEVPEDQGYIAEGMTFELWQEVQYLNSLGPDELRLVLTEDDDHNNDGREDASGENDADEFRTHGSNWLHELN